MSVATNAFELLVFDWDGTIMDSANKIVSCFHKAAKDCALTVPPKTAVQSIIGLSLEQAWLALKPGLSDRQIEELATAYRRHFLQSDPTPTPLYDGVIEGLKCLDQAPRLLAIATGKSRLGLEKSLNDSNLRPHFVTSRCGDETFSKPNPQMLLEIMDFCGVEAARTLMIGDTLYDLQMAAQADVASLAVSYGVGQREELAPVATLGVVDSFPELAQWLG